MGELTTEAIERWNEIDPRWQAIALDSDDYSYLDSFDYLLTLFLDDEDMVWAINDLCDIAEHNEAEYG